MIEAIRRASIKPPWQDPTKRPSLRESRLNCGDLGRSLDPARNPKSTLSFEGQLEDTVWTLHESYGSVLHLASSSESRLSS